MADNLQTALSHAARGWYVFPTREVPGEPYTYKDKKTGEMITKIPEIKTPYTKHGHTDATNDPEQIRRWWGRWPGALVGVYCAMSGFWSLDVDTPDGFISLAELVNTYGNGEPITPGITQDTPSGGAHDLFRLPEGVKIPNTEGKLGKGLDLRSNGYICTGRLPDGSGYTWLPGHSPDEHPLTDAPAWLIERIRIMGNGAKPAPPVRDDPGLRSKTPRPMGSDSGDKVQWAQNLLARLLPRRCADYDEWVEVGMSLSALGESGFTLWDTWSKGCVEKYHPGECSRKWESFTPGDGITLGSLYHWAEEDNPGGSDLKGKAVDPHPPEPDAWPEELQTNPVRAPDRGQETAGELLHNTSPARFELCHISKVLQPRAPIVWRVQNLIAEGYLSIWFGEPGSKKTWSLLDLAVCLAQGSKWLDFETTQCPVLWVDEEMGENRMLDRLQSAAAGHFADVNTLPLYYASYARFDFRNKGDTAALHNLILQTGAGLVVVDALMEVVPGADENSVKDMKPALIDLDEIAKRTGAATVLIHHSNRGGDYRGTSALKGSVDVLLKVESKKDSPNIDFEVEKARDTESIKFSARANFGPGQFWLSGSDRIESAPRLSKSQEYVIRYLAENGQSGMDDIKGHADRCTDNAARQAVFSLVSAGLVQRADSGGSGQKAFFALTKSQTCLIDRLT